MTRWYLLLPIGVVACAPRASAPPPSPWHAPLAVRDFGVDPAFTPAERAALADAATALEVQTRGRVVVRIGNAWIEAPWFVAHQLRGDPQDTWAREHFHGPVYGWTDFGSVYIVADRHRDMHALEHTAMHEFLHSIGVSQHVSGNPDAIMAAGADASAAPLTLALEDRIAIAKALGCEVW